jgi:hypothetical protein
MKTAFRVRRKSRLKDVTLLRCTTQTAKDCASLSELDDQSTGGLVSFASAECHSRKKHSNETVEPGR